jgi:hypothetical protein
MFKMLEVEKKSKESKYNKVVFLIDLDELLIENKHLYNFIRINGILPIECKNYIFLYNSGNYIFFEKNIIIHPSVILYFMNKLI